jgi:uncharacterized surface protein with fasciclin (FAS1) repeats
MNRTLASSLFVTLPLALGACGAANDNAPAATTAAASAPDVVDTAAAAGSFKTLVAALRAADLETTLRSAGPFTVFAPTDEAFARLPPGTVDSLLRPENKAKLQQVLEYHVVAGRVPSSEVVKLAGVKTLAGEEVAIGTEGGGVQVGAANVVKPDVVCKNGVVHVIDRVLLP